MNSAPTTATAPTLGKGDIVTCFGDNYIIVKDPRHVLPKRLRRRYDAFIILRKLAKGKP